MLIDDLRLATADLHQRTENAFDLTAACASRAAYAALLTKFLRLYRPLERRVTQLPLADLGVDFSTRRGSSWLARDLASLDAPTDVADDPVAAALPVADLSAAAGVLYVLEGSTLGGQFIRKHVSRTLGLGADDGCAFFTGYGEQTIRRWRGFVDALNAFGGRPKTRARAACDAAVGTFHAFESAMRGP